MLDQADNLNYFFRLRCYFISIFVSRNCSFKSLLYIFWKFIIYQVIVYRRHDCRDIKFSVIYLKCCSICFCCFSATGLGRLATTAAVLHISEIIHSFEYDESSSISQLIKGKSRNLQKLLKYFNGTTQALCLMYYYCLVCPLLFSSYTQKIYLLLSCCYLLCNYQHHYFHSHLYLLHFY